MHESIAPVETGKRLLRLYKEKDVTAHNTERLLHPADCWAVANRHEERNQPVT